MPLWERLGRAVGIRVALFSALTAVIVQLLATTHLYATATILFVLCALIAHDLRGLMARAQQDMRRVAESRTAASPFDERERRQREQRLQYSEALLDTVGAALFVVHEDGSSLPANRQARRLAGHSISNLHEIAALGSATAELLSAMQPGARHVTRLADGQPIYVSAAEFRAGESRHRLLSLQRIAGELDAVEFKAWQDVARVLTHEMMNSLTPIASLSESLEHLLRDARRNGAEEATSGELSGALEAIKRRSHGLMNFVERYRAVAELPEPDLQPVDLEQLFVGIDRLMSTTLRESGVSYRRRTESAVPSILADADLLEQAIINLIRNAAEAARDVETPFVTVECEVREDELAIVVGDNGPGLNEQQREQIFVPFYSTKSGGSGIGLSLARQVAFAHRGRIEVEANHPSGAVFSLVLPKTSSSR